MFDPYHKWLGIPPKDQPPNHYRLLAIDLFESDRDVIDHAADRQMTHVRSFQTGAHAQWSQRLLNEIANARVCLLDPQKKQQYDTELKRATRSQAEPKASLPAQPPAAPPVAPIAVAIPSPVAPQPLIDVHARPAQPRAGKRSSSRVPLILLGVAAVAVLVILFAALRSATNPAQQTAQQQPEGAREAPKHATPAATHQAVEEPVVSPPSTPPEVEPPAASPPTSSPSPTVDRPPENSPIPTLAASEEESAAAREKLREAHERSLEEAKTPATAANSTQKKAVVEQCLALFEVAMAQDQFEALAESGAAALALARQTRDASFIERVNARSKEVAALAEEYQAFVAALDILKQDVDDAAANRTVGKYVCFLKGKWDQGLPALARGDDETLAMLAASELAAPSEATKQKLLADGWWDAAEKLEPRRKSQIHKHAARWYQACRSSFTGVPRAVIERRLADARRPNSESIADGLKWLARQQRSDGSWTFGAGPNPGKLNAPTAATAMALLPFLRTAPDAPEYKTVVRDGLEYLRSRMKRDGDLTEPGPTMYGQALGTLALCEAFEQMRDLKVRSQAQLGVAFIVNAQDPKGGGWRYKPREPGDTSVTVWQLTALAAASRVKLQIPPRTFKLAGTFLDFVQADAGSSYGYQDPAGGDKTALSAMGLLCRLHLGGDPKQPAIAQGIQKVLSRGCRGDDSYFNYYATLLAREAGGDERTLWDSEMKIHLISNQAASGDAAGSWISRGRFLPEQGGRLGVTSISLLTLICLDD